MLNKDTYNFPQTTSKKQSTSNRKLKYGVGVNDSTYDTTVNIHGKRTVCPAYSAWDNMLKRCYSCAYKERKPTYESCSVSTEWLVYSNFYEWWMEQPDSKNLQLDKDIRLKGNKVYSPVNCQYVTTEVNNLFNDCRVVKGEYPTGTNWDAKSGKVRARVNHNGKRKHLGMFTCKVAAYNAYKKAKNVVIKEVASRQNKKLEMELLRHLYVD